MYSARGETLPSITDYEQIDEAFIVYPLVHGSYDLYPVREHEWVEGRLGGQQTEPGNPNAHFLAQKLQEGFREVGQNYWPSRTIDRDGTPLPYLDPRDEDYAEQALKQHARLVEHYGHENVIACRPSRDRLMSPDRAPIDEVIFLVKED